MKKIFRAWNGRTMEYGGFSVHATGKILPLNCGLSNVTEKSPLMQYVGIKDREGKRIFEGDIINYDGFFWVWKWDSVNTGFTIARKRIKSPDHKDREDGFIYFMVSPTDKHKLKIIGNRFENPELLEDFKKE